MCCGMNKEVGNVAEAELIRFWLGLKGFESVCLKIEAFWFL